MTLIQHEEVKLLTGSGFKFPLVISISINAKELFAKKTTNKKIKNNMFFIPLAFRWHQN